jgi:hypothetical protein
VPLYYDFDGTADNSFRDIPAEVMGAGQVATLRMSKAQNLTDLTLLLSGAAKGGDVYIMTTDDGTPLTAWTSAGFVDTNAAGSWHDGNMDVVPFRLLGMHAGPNATVKISGATRDYVVLVRASSS